MRYGITILPDLAWREAEPRWRDAEAMGFTHGWTYDHITFSGLPTSAWRAAMPTLTAAAMVTSTLQLGTFVASPNTHEPVQFAREAIALQDVSAGRVLLAIGKGGDLDAAITGRDLSLRDRSRRFREFAGLLRRLLVEEHVTHDGDFYAAREVVTGAAVVFPIPIVLAGDGPLATAFAAKHGDGWVTTGGRAETNEAWWASLRELTDKLEETLAEVGRDPASFDRYLNLDSGPQFSLESVGAFADAVGRASELGFTDLVTHWPRPEGPYAGKRDTLEAVADLIVNPEAAGL